MYFKWFTIGVVLILPVGLQTELMAKQNVVIILADDVGREVLGCYGGTSYKTPRIDELAASGTRFEQCYVMPMCHPTRIALLTGQYPFRLGHPEWLTFPKAAETHTIAHTFKRAGYRTCVSGKWQLALISEDRDHPHRLGFDEYCVTGGMKDPGSTIRLFGRTAKCGPTLPIATGRMSNAIMWSISLVAKEVTPFSFTTR